MTSLTLRLALVFVALATGLAMTNVAAATEADVVLTVTDAKAGPKSVTFDRADLEKLRQVTYRTSTIWTDGVLVFQGVPLSEVLKAAGVTGGSILLGASNDYQIEMPMAAVTPDVPIVAMTIDGKPMSLRDKGPLWVIYPYDQSTIYQSEVIYTRSVWQLERIEVLP